MDNRRAIVNAAIFISFLSIVPRVIPRVDFNNSDHPAPAGMTSSAIVAVQIAARSVMPLNTLAFLFAFGTVLLEAARADPPLRLQRASLFVSVHCFGLSNICLNYARMFPLDLLSGFSVCQGLMVFLTLLSFFYSLGNIF